MSSMSAWSTYQVPDQSGLHSETLSKREVGDDEKAKKRSTHTETHTLRLRDHQRRGNSKILRTGVKQYLLDMTELLHS